MTENNIEARGGKSEDESELLKRIEVQIELSLASARNVQRLLECEKWQQTHAMFQEARAGVESLLLLINTARSRGLSVEHLNGSINEINRMLEPIISRLHRHVNE
jgi:hypothetical protein